MQTRTKIVVDRLIGLPLAWAGNLAARILGKTLRRDHTSTARNVRTVVFAKYVGMGSIIQATPLMRSVRAAYPDAKIIVLTGRGCDALVKRMDFVDSVITIDDRSLVSVARTSLSAIATLIRERVDLFFDLEVYSAYASIMALLTLSRNRIGFFRESAEHKRGNYTHLMYFNTRHAIRYIYLQLGRLVGCEPVEPDRLGPIRIDEADHEGVREKLKGRGLESGSYIVINPNASDLLTERRWPRENFATLIDHLTERLGLPIVLIGTKSEREYVQGVVDLLAPDSRCRVFNTAGDLSLGELFALLQKARCVVTNDTGPMHMAWAVNAPTVCLFGPVHPDHYGLDGVKTTILYKQLYCSPCVHEIDLPPCQGNNVCMKRIGVDEVSRAVTILLMSRAPKPLRMVDPEFLLDQNGHPLGQVTRDFVS